VPVRDNFPRGVSFTIPPLPPFPPVEGDREAAKEAAWEACRAAWRGEGWRGEDEEGVGRVGREGRRPEEDRQASNQLATPPAIGEDLFI